MPDTPYTLVAVTTFGIEAVAARELETLGYPKIRDGHDPGPGRVRFQGGPEAIARANVFLRSAERVQLLVSAFDAPDFDALFDGVRAIPWEDWLPPGAAFPVGGRSVRSRLSSVPAVQRTVKRAIADRLASVRHPGVPAGEARVPEDGPEYGVEIALLDDRASLLLDTTGPGLNKRGYRDRVGEAQLRETLAAALLLLSRWTPERELIDPFCGTGTIAIEAAMMARRLAPGRRRGFASERWAWLPERAWADARTEADDLAVPNAPARIIATDREPEAVSLARRHAERAGVGGDIHVQQRDFRDLSTKTEHGVVVTNPPYGHRLGDRRELDTLYRSFPTVFSRLPTWSVGVLTGYPGFEQAVGRQADRRRKLFNARVEATFYQFDGPPPPRRDREDTAPRENASPDDHARRERERPAAPFARISAAPHASTDAFVNRVAKMAHHRRRWPETEGTTAYRLYQRDLPDVPLHVDRFGDRIVLTQVGRPRIDAELWRAQIGMLGEALTERLELSKGALFVRAEGVRADPVTLRFAEHGLEMAVRCPPDGPLPFRLDLRAVRAWLRSQAREHAVLVGGDRDGTMILSALHASSNHVLADASPEARSLIDATAHARGIDLKGRLRPVGASARAGAGVVLCPKPEHIGHALDEVDVALADDAHVLLVTGPTAEALPAVHDEAEHRGFGVRDHTRRTEPGDCPGWHRSWLLRR